ncbi:MAG: hypothetical protein PF572_02055 [Patescibacteria group bacterium]|jgi:hypothetical protein|nr:hypothetical protein [Patescibacteria group bacterium]
MKNHVAIIFILVSLFLSACSANVNQTSKFDPEHANHHFSFHQEGNDYSRGSFYYLKDFRLLVEVQSVIIHSNSKAAHNYNQANCINVATIMNQLEENGYYLMEVKNVDHIEKIATKQVIINVGKTPYVSGGTFTTDEQSMYITNRNFIESGAVQIEIRISNRNMIEEIEDAISKI